ncbi:MAG: histidine kinase, partial [Sphingomicrobium sp.]
MNDTAASVAAETEDRAAGERPAGPRSGSLTRRMSIIAAAWIVALLVIGGFALDRVLSRSIVDNFDNQQNLILKGMIGASEIGPDGEVRFTRPPADQRFIEPYSGLYFQISGDGADTFASRSLWDRRLRVAERHKDNEPHLYDSNEFSTAENPEPLRIVERDAILPGSQVRWRFQVAQSRETIDDQIGKLRRTLIW